MGEKVRSRSSLSDGGRPVSVGNMRAYREQPPEPARGDEVGRLDRRFKTGGVRTRPMDKYDQMANKITPEQWAAEHETYKQNLGRAKP